MKINLRFHRSKAVLFCGSFFVMYISCLSCCHVSLLQPCCHLLGKGSPLGSLVCDVFLCFRPFGVLDKVWNLIVSIPDLCLLSYFVLSLQMTLRKACLDTEIFLAESGDRTWDFSTRGKCANH